MEKIPTGLLGGTFNPIHNGHLELAYAAMRELNLDQVWFIPSGCSYMKNMKEIVSAKDRLAMLSLAIEDEPNFSMNDLEILREGNTYTVETLIALNEEFPNRDFYFIMGADNLFQIEKWMRVQEIFQHATIVATVRDDLDLASLERKKDDLVKQFGARIILFRMKPCDISSTMVRDYICNGTSVQDMIPQKVYSYIKSHHLYKKDEKTNETV